MIGQTFVFLLLSLFTSFAFAQHDTPNNWKCVNPAKGSWSFGRAPVACDASSFGDDKFIWNNFDPLVFRDVRERSPEVSRYMGDLHATLREAALYYYHTRKPQAPLDEQEAWARAVLALAHQESYWSHYRQASDARLKLMRGDSGHGHGLLQVDDRWHFVAIEKGVGWNIIDNFLYGMEEYYSGWLAATNKSCLQTSRDWRNRARTAYSAYNGGPSQACRWTNPNDRWAQNDRGYAEKYDLNAWKRYATSAQPVVDVGCWIEGGTNCKALPPAVAGGLTTEQLAIFSDGHICRLDQGSLLCVADLKDRSCLDPLGLFSEVSGDQDWLARYSVRVFDRHVLCYANVAGLIPVGQYVKLLQPSLLTATPIGPAIANMPAESSWQVLDFTIDPVSHERHYRIQLNADVVGYVAAGNPATWNQHAVGTASRSGGVIAIPKTKVEVMMAAGLRLRAEPDGTILGTLPIKTVVEVQGVTIRGPENRVYYEVRALNKTGFIYSGRLNPEPNLSEWTRAIK